MVFNHYAKIKRILDSQPPGWYIRRINQPTTALNFKGEMMHYDHYYRVYSADHNPVKYCKFQKIDKFARIMNCTVADLPILD